MRYVVIVNGRNHKFCEENTMGSHLYTCDKCGGSGALELEGVLRKTIECLDAHPFGLTVKELSDELGTELSATGMRLRTLMQKGLIKRRKEAAAFIYEIAV
jgi:predicted transcriptional regulator